VGEALRWLDGDGSRRPQLEPLLRALAGEAGPLELLRDKPGRRRLLRAELAGAGACFVKQFPRGRGLRASAKRLLGQSPPQREWRALRRLHARGVPVPRPLARLALPDGGCALVTEWVEARPLAEALGAGRAERRALLEALGLALRRLHAAGWVHRDLHRENVMATAGGPLLVDLQLALPLRGWRWRRRDLGELDHSLSGVLSCADRVRLRAAALGLSRPFGPAARATLRDVGRASERRAQAYYRSRTRRSLREGRLYHALRLDDARGLCVRDVPEPALRDALAHAAVGGRALDTAAGPVCATRWRAGPLAALADAARGSPARRAWLAGHGLRARGLACVRPLAFAERRRLGVPLESWLVAERVDRRMDDAAAGEPGRALALAAWLALAHRRGVDAAGLAARDLAAGPGPRLARLVGVRLRARPPREARRIEALARLNASLPDALPAAERWEAFRRYARALPFRGGERAALQRVVLRSLALADRWSGADCALARGAAQPELTVTQRK
jgi:tRNA A-37 threonylcarbamoyl transferase component Bud32